LVVNRHYVRGRHGRSGELSLLPKVNPFKSSQTALARPVEDVVSVEGFIAAFRVAGLPVERVGDVDLDDPQVQAVLDDWLQSAADLLYLPLLSMVCVIDPDAVLIGGHLPRPVTQRLAVEVGKRLSLNLGADWSENAVRPCRVTQDAAAVGAGVIAFRDRWDRDLRE
jgi:predicted NBD/HSP70 family sugar kinase